MKLIDLLEICATEMCATAGVFGIRALWRYFRQVGNKIVVDSGAELAMIAIEFVKTQQFWDRLDRRIDVTKEPPKVAANRILFLRFFMDKSFSAALDFVRDNFSEEKHLKKVFKKDIQDFVSLED